MTLRHTMLAMLLSLAGAAKRAAPPPKPQTPTIGDTLEIRAPDSYLGKNMQVVGVLTPLSSRRRVIDRKTGEFTGMKRRRGMIHWYKKRESWPFERLKRQPFTIRYLREDPAGVALTLAQEGKIMLMDGEDEKKRKVVGLVMAKPKRWWPF